MPTAFVTEAMKAEYGAIGIWKADVLQYDGGKSGVGTLANLTMTASPSAVDGDAYDETDGGVARSMNGSTQYMTVPKAVVQRMLTQKKGTILWFGKRNTATGTGAQEFNGSDSGGGYPFYNEVILGASMTPTLAADTNKVAFAMTNASGTTIGAFVTASGGQLNGKWHMFGGAFDSSQTGLWAVYDGKRSAATTIAGDGSDLPTSASIVDFSIGAYNRSGSRQYLCPWTYDYIMFCDEALTDAQLFALADAFNGNTGDTFDNPDAFAAILRKARQQIVNFSHGSDSNKTRSHTPSSGAGNGIPAYDQGNSLTAVTMLKTALGNRPIMGYMSGCRNPCGATDAYFLGVFNRLFAAELDTPEDHIKGANLALWNDTQSTFVAPAANIGFAPDARWLSNTRTLSRSSQRIIFDPTSRDWQWSAAQNFVLDCDLATFATNGGTAKPSFTRGGTPVSGSDESLDCQTGSDGWLYAGDGGVRLSVGSLSDQGIFSLGDSGNDTRSGKLGAANIHFYDDNASTGFDYADSFQYPGGSAFTWATALATDISPETTLDKIALWMQRFVAPAIAKGQTPTFVLWITFGQNDINVGLTSTSLTYSALVDSGDGGWDVNGESGRTREGYKANIKSIVDFYRDAWNVAGYADEDFHVLLGGYHMVEAMPGNWTMQQMYARAERELIDEAPWGSRACRIAGEVIASYDNLWALSNESIYGTGHGYCDVGGVQTSHLSRGGYLLIGQSAGEEAAGLLPSSPAGGARDRSRSRSR